MPTTVPATPVSEWILFQNCQSDKRVDGEWLSIRRHMMAFQNRIQLYVFTFSYTCVR
jgi:hypothetical protein